MSADTNPNLHPALTGWTGQPYERHIRLLDVFGPAPSTEDATTLHLWLKAWVGAPVTVDARGCTPLPTGWLYTATNHIPYAQVQWRGLTQTDQAALAYVVLTGPKTTSS